MRPNAAQLAILKRSQEETAVLAAERANGHAVTLPVLDTRPIVVAALSASQPSEKLRPLATGYPMRRLVTWLQRQIVTPRRTVRLLQWPLLQWPRLWSLLRALAGGRVTDAEREARLAECRSCPRRIVWVKRVHPLAYQEHEYCEACRCGFHALARLPFKASLKEWHCPERRWPDAYPDAEMRAYLVKRGLTTEAEIKALDAAGCQTCGGVKH